MAFLLLNALQLLYPIYMREQNLLLVKAHRKLQFPLIPDICIEL